MYLWDYQLPKNWQPQTDQEWQWFLIRKLNYGDFKGLPKKTIRKYLPQIKKHLDSGVAAMLENYFSTQKS